MITLQLTESELLDLVSAVSDGIDSRRKRIDTLEKQAPYPIVQDYQDILDADREMLKSYRELRKKISQKAT